MLNSLNGVILHKKSKKQLANGGRPTIINNNVLQKLRRAFIEGANDITACHYANIAPSTFYAHLKTNEIFSDEIHKWKEMIRHESVLKIRKMIKAKDTGTEDAWKWLERRYPSEFAPIQQPNTLIDNKSVTNYIDFKEDKPIIENIK